MEIHRICEVTATPLAEGANLSESIRAISGLGLVRVNRVH